MFCTTFRTEKFIKLPAGDHFGFLDLAWWKAIKPEESKMINREHALGIKHSIFGKLGGNGHTMTFTRFDQTLNYLRSRLDKEAFEFYHSIKQAYQIDYENQFRKK
jgi:hypothetical protein